MDGRDAVRSNHEERHQGECRGGHGNITLVAETIKMTLVMRGLAAARKSGDHVRHGRVLVERQRTADLLVSRPNDANILVVENVVAIAIPGGELLGNQQ